jgi:hypothetical protein
VDSPKIKQYQFKPLRDDQTVEKVLQIWTMGRYFKNSHAKSLVLIEVLTSKGEKVIFSRVDVVHGHFRQEPDIGLGRATIDTEHGKAFHMLEYEPDVTQFKQIYCANYLALAID